MPSTRLSPNHDEEGEAPAPPRAVTTAHRTGRRGLLSGLILLSTAALLPSEQGEVLLSRVPPDILRLASALRDTPQIRELNFWKEPTAWHFSADRGVGPSVTGVISPDDPKQTPDLPEWVRPLDTALLGTRISAIETVSARWPVLAIKTEAGAQDYHWLAVRGPDGWRITEEPVEFVWHTLSVEPPKPLDTTALTQGTVSTSVALTTTDL